jgi:hypothetical protein
MSEKNRGNLITSGPARFSFLSAFHPGITSRQVHYLGPKLSISHPTELFDVICKLEIVTSHISHYAHTNQMVICRTDELKIYCKSLSRIYQVFTFLFKVDLHPKFLGHCRTLFIFFFYFTKSNKKNFANENSYSRLNICSRRYRFLKQNQSICKVFESRKREKRTFPHKKQIPKNIYLNSAKTED